MRRKDSSSSIFTNPTRVDTFGRDDQEVWKRGCLKAHQILNEDLYTINVSLLEIYDTLRTHRADLAKTQYKLAEKAHNDKFDDKNEINVSDVNTEKQKK